MDTILNIDVTIKNGSPSNIEKRILQTSPLDILSYNQNK